MKPRVENLCTMRKIRLNNEYDKKRYLSPFAPLFTVRKHQAAHVTRQDLAAAESRIVCQWLPSSTCMVLTPWWTEADLNIFLIVFLRDPKLLERSHKLSIWISLESGWLLTIFTYDGSTSEEKRDNRAYRTLQIRNTSRSILSDCHLPKRLLSCSNFLQGLMAGIWCLLPINGRPTGPGGIFRRKITVFIA